MSAAGASVCTFLTVLFEFELFLWPLFSPHVATVVLLLLFLKSSSSMPLPHDRDRIILRLWPLRV